jgi:hypothetical protein
MRQGSAPAQLALGPVAVRSRSGVEDMEGVEHVDEDRVVLCEAAVAALGLSRADTPLAVDLPPVLGERRLMPLLSHAGPSLMAWSKTRGVGPDDVVTPFGGRRALALDAQGWAGVIEDFGRATAVCAQRGAHTIVLNAERDSLLGAALSPRYAPGWSDGQRHALLAAIVQRACALGVQVGLLVVVEECAPGGLDPAGGVAAAEVAVEAGASFLIADARSAWFAMRGAEQSALQGLASAAWLVPRVSVPVHAQVPAVAARSDLANVLARAKASGIDGVVIVEEGAGK